MLALPIVPARSIVLVFALSVALTLISAAVPWPARHLRDRYLVMAVILGLVVGIAAGVIGAVRDLSLSPVTDLMVLVVAWTGGLLLGRGIPPRFSSFLLLFLCFSAMDILLAVGRYPQVPRTTGNASPLAWATFNLALPGWSFAINVVDLLLLTAVAEHWRRRGAGYLLALLPGFLGFLLADGVILVTGLALLPGFPFFTAGYLGSEGVYRSVTGHRVAPSLPPASHGR
jgi:hypothetical protein